jgi:uncharacterized protein YceH (UPF0502 family)
MTDETAAPTEETQQKWQPLGPRERRVVGVLIEKAKTTPDAYPLTLNALTTGCNQKSNRSPQMNLSHDDAADALDRLREMGAVLEIQGSGRMPKYRHQMYDWLGVDKTEIAVMAELLLRGEQTIGELRARASRMEPISGLAELKPVLQSLVDKGLVVQLTPEGRGQMVTHGLYTEREMKELDTHRAPPAAGPPLAASDTTATSEHVCQDDFDQLRAEFAELRDEVHRLRSQIEELQQTGPEG